MTTRWLLHVDLDQFIAAVEVLRRPDLRGRPVVVGGDGDPAKRGVVATASYEARGHGVHSGLRMRTAARRCPDAVFLPVDKPAYEAVSDVVMDVLRELVPTVEVMGWDEAFIAVETDDPEAVAQEIRAQVAAAARLECTVGIGENRLQAKLASGFGKPGSSYLFGKPVPIRLRAHPARTCPDRIHGPGRRLQSPRTPRSAAAETDGWRHRGRPVAARAVSLALPQLGPGRSYRMASTFLVQNFSRNFSQPPGRCSNLMPLPEPPYGIERPPPDRNVLHHRIGLIINV